MKWAKRRPMELRSAQKEWKFKDDAKETYQNIEKHTKNQRKYPKINRKKKTNKKCV